MIYTFDLTGKVILITGGYSYLGKAAAESLVYHGGTVFVLGRTKSKFDSAFQEHPEFEKKIHFRECDISDTASIKKAYRAVMEMENGMDVLINNAFYLEGQDPLAMTDEQWNTGIDGILNSVYRCIREAAPYLEKSGSPRIINVSSMYGLVAPDFDIYEDFNEMISLPHYGAAKAGVVQLSKYFAGYFGKKGVTVNTVTPGAFPTDSVQKKEKFLKRLKEKTVLKRIGKPEDLAGAFVFLASDASGYITGQNITVDGGWTAI